MNNFAVFFLFFSKPAEQRQKKRKLSGMGFEPTPPFVDQNVRSVRLKSYGDRAFEVAASQMWNTLPVDVKPCSSIDTFKKRLKTYLFEMAFK